MVRSQMQLSVASRQLKPSGRWALIVFRVSEGRAGVAAVAVGLGRFAG